MRKIGLFTAAAALVMFGLVMWTTSSTHALVATTGIDPSALMVGVKDLPATQIHDYSPIFN